MSQIQISKKFQAKLDALDATLAAVSLWSIFVICAWAYALVQDWQVAVMGLCGLWLGIGRVRTAWQRWAKYRSIK